MLSHIFHLIVLGICETLKVTFFQLCRKAESCKTLLSVRILHQSSSFYLFTPKHQMLPPPHIFPPPLPACLSHFLRNLHLHDLCHSPNCLEDTDSSYKARGIQKHSLYFGLPEQTWSYLVFILHGRFMNSIFFFALRAE